MIDSSRHFLLCAVAISAVALSSCGRIWYDPLARDGSDGGRDAGRDAMVATDGGSLDAQECVPGTPCSTGDACTTGAIDCATGTAVCSSTGDAPTGTPCPGGVCDGGGTCVACVGGSDCPTGEACRSGTLACDSGAPVCTDSGAAPVGTPCPGGACDGAGSCIVATRRFTCGWAISGYGCDNGRASVNVMSVDMGAAIIACRSMIPAAYPDFCYVRNALIGGVPDVSDMMYCADADPPPGTWRPASSCCNFMGTLSCP